MAGDNAGVSGFRDLAPIVSSLAKWARLCRIGLDARNEVSSPEEVVRTAGEREIAPREIDPVSAQLPNSAALLRKMMTALGIEPEAAAVSEHAIMAELQRLCASCDHKPECARDLAEGTATENFYAYCPNARALDSIYVEMTFNRL